jgi:hypothetical protein
MAPIDDKPTKRSWGQQLARLCCGELLGKYGDQPQAEYEEGSHGMRFHNGKGEQGVDFPLDETQPHDLVAHARDLVNRYSRHIERDSDKSGNPPKAP